MYHDSTLLCISKLTPVVLSPAMDRSYQVTLDGSCVDQIFRLFVERTPERWEVENVMEQFLRSVINQIPGGSMTVYYAGEGDA